MTTVAAQVFAVSPSVFDETNVMAGKQANQGMSDNAEALFGLQKSVTTSTRVFRQLVPRCDGMNIVPKQVTQVTHFLLECLLA